MRISRKHSKMLLPFFFITLLVLSARCGEQRMETNESASSAADDGVVQVKFSHNLTESTANGRAAVAFKEKLEELTGGRMQVEIYPNQQLGSMREQVEQTQFGSIQMTMQGTSVLSSFVPALTIMDLPFLFPNHKTMWSVLRGEVGEELLAALDDVKLKGLTFLAHGFRQITTQDGPINSPEDLKGMKFRVMPSELLIDTIRAWGANPTPIDFAELYNSLQQGVVTAEDNVIETIYDKKLYEVQRNLTISNHNYLAYLLVANKAWYDGLDDDGKNAIAAAASYAADYSDEMSFKTNEEIAGKIKAAGMVITELPEQGKREFRELSQEVYDKYVRAERDQLILAKIQQAVQDAANAGQETVQ